MDSFEDRAVEKAEIVSFDDRMQRLKAFCESIPTEYRSPPSTDASTSTDDKSNETLDTRSQTTPTTSSTPTDPLDSSLDVRVGRITKVWEHSEADKLYCEEVDVGEDEPRLICSGLRPYMAAEDLQDRLAMRFVALPQLCMERKGRGRVSVRSQQKFLDNLNEICKKYRQDAIVSTEQMRLLLKQNYVYHPLRVVIHYRRKIGSSELFSKIEALHQHLVYLSKLTFRGSVYWDVKNQRSTLKTGNACK